jgi:uncharacterized membrane protein YfcA
MKYSYFPGSVAVGGPASLHVRNVINKRLEMIDPLYVASGFAAGLIVGMAAVGGGSLMTPRRGQ